MTRDYERVKQKVAGRPILIVSWYDLRTQTWRASAPEFSYLSREPFIKPVEGSSRQRAVEQLVDLLMNYFESRES